jgi:HK97 family phage prohead protease
VDETLLLQDPTALKAYTFMKAGVIKGMSIGFETLQSSINGDVRQLKELRLWEISVVTFPPERECADSERQVPEPLRR